MAQQKATKSKRPALTSVGIRRDVQLRLRDYIYECYPRPVLADVVSEAVEKWLDKQEGAGDIRKQDE